MLSYSKKAEKCDKQGKESLFLDLYGMRDEPPNELVYFPMHLNIGNMIYTKDFEGVYGDDKKKVFEKYLLRQKAIQNCYGMLGDQVAKHSHDIFKYIKKNFSNNKDEEGMKLNQFGIVQLKKACNYSTKYLKQIYLFDLIEEYHSSDQTVLLEQTLEAYKNLNPFLHKFLHCYYVSKQPLSGPVNVDLLKGFVSNYALLSQIQLSSPKLFEFMAFYFNLDPVLKYVSAYQFYNEFVKNKMIEACTQHIFSNNLLGDLKFQLEQIGQITCRVQGGKIEGEFHLEFLDGSKLKLNYENGEISGSTYYELSDNTIIEEHFKNGIKEGIFKLKSYKETLEGEFAQNKLVYMKTPTHQSEREIYFGEQKFYTRTGLGTFFKQKISGQKDENDIHNNITGSVKIGMWLANILKFGQEIEYGTEKSFRMKKQFDIVEGEYSGVLIEYTKNKKAIPRKQVRFFVKGRQIGREFYFQDNGNLYKEKEFDIQQQKFSIIKYYESGEVRFKYQKYQEHYDGKYEEFYKNGALKSVTEYDEYGNKLSYNEYYPSGSVFTTAKYKKYSELESPMSYLSEDGDVIGTFISQSKAGQKMILSENGKISKFVELDEDGDVFYIMTFNQDGDVQSEKNLQTEQSTFYDRHSKLLGEFDGKYGIDVTKFYSTGEQKCAMIKPKQHEKKHTYRYFKNGQIQRDRYKDEDENFIKIFYDMEGKELPRNVVYKFHDNGQFKFKCEFDYQKNGKYEQFYDNGVKSAEGTYRDDYLHGISTYYCINQDLKYEIEYRKDKFFSYSSFQGGNKVGEQIGLVGAKNGLFFSFFNTGNLEYIEEYKDNILVGKRQQFYSNGNLLREAQYSQGEIVGEEKWYYPNGTLLKSSLYKNGHLDGPTVFFDREGKIDCKMMFSDHQLTGIQVINPIFKNFEGM